MRGLHNLERGFFPAANDYGFPELEAVPALPVLPDVISWYSFPDRNKVELYGSSGLHFFCDDFVFENVWKQPTRYIELFKVFGCIVQPDYSLYYDMPVALQIFNKYRNHWLSRYFSFYGVNVIPNINVSTPDCWEWSFLGYPKNSVVAFSDIGSVQLKSDREVLHNAYDQMIKVLDPVQILYFTRNRDSAPAETVPIQINFGK